MEEIALTRGDLASGKTVVTTNSKKSAEAIVLHLVGRRKG